MLTHITYSVALVFGTVFIHAACTALALGWVRSLAAHHWALRGPVHRTSALARWSC